MSSIPVHPLDSAIALRSDSTPNRFVGAASRAYNNMIGPFGGSSAAIAMNAVMQHPARLGHPIALTVNFAAPLSFGPLAVVAVPTRTNRSTQHWSIEVLQSLPGQAETTVLSGTAVTANRRDTWSDDETAMPDAPKPTDVPSTDLMPGIDWIQRYELRTFEGATPIDWDERSRPSRIRMWVRDHPPRPLDFCALTAICDTFPPRVWLRRARRVPVGTVSMTTYFHTDAATLVATGEGHLLGQAQGQVFRNGFFDQTGQVWNQEGVLLATTHQLTYFQS